MRVTAFSRFLIWTAGVAGGSLLFQKVTGHNALAVMGIDTSLVPFSPSLVPPNEVSSSPSSKSNNLPLTQGGGGGGGGFGTGEVMVQPYNRNVPYVPNLDPRAYSARR